MTTKSKQIKKPSRLDLEEAKEEKFELKELKSFQDPAKQEEAKRKLADLAAKLNELSKQSEISLKKIHEESKHERGPINKMAHWIKRLKDKALADGSTSYDSINFLSATVGTLKDYEQKIPVHIKEFQTAIDKLKQGQAHATKIMKIAREEFVKLEKEWKEIKKEVEAETDKQKKSILKTKEQDVRDALQNAEIKGNKFMKKLENYTYSREMFLGLKSAYETLLQQLGNLEETLTEHLKVLKTVGPSVKEVENVVLSIHRFTQAIDGYRKRDNLAVRYSTRAVKEISPAVQQLENPWYGKKTVEEVKKNAAEAKKVFKEHFGTDIKSLEKRSEETGGEETGDDSGVGDADVQID